MTINNLRVNKMPLGLDKPYKLILDNFYLNLEVGFDFLEEKIREAAYAAAYRDTKMSHLFSLNDVYVNLGFQPCRSVAWAKRQEILSPGIIRSVLKKSGFGSIQRSGGARVSRYYHNAAERGGRT